MKKGLILAVILILSGCLSQAPAPTPPPTTTPSPTISPTLDTDKDGITDVVETNIGTDVNRLTISPDLNLTEEQIGKLCDGLRIVNLDIESFKTIEIADYRKYWDSLARYENSMPKRLKNISDPLSYAESYEKNQKELSKEFTDLLNAISSSIPEEKKLEYIRAWNAKYTIDKTNDTAGSGSIYRTIIDMMEENIRVYNTTGDVKYMQANIALAKEGIGAADRIESILHSAYLVYDNTEKDAQLSQNYKSYTDKAMHKTWQTTATPGWESFVESKRIISEVQRQLELQTNASQDSITELGSTNFEFSDYIWFSLEPKDRGTLLKILNYMEKDNRKKVIDILNTDKNRYGSTELNDILDEHAGNWEKYAAMCIENGIKADALHSIHNIAVVANDIVGVNHNIVSWSNGTLNAVVDKYDKRSINFINNLGDISELVKLSDKELLKIVIKALPKFNESKSGPTSIKDIWEKNEAVCIAYAILTSDISRLFGRPDIYIGHLIPLEQLADQNTVHAINFSENENSELSLFDPLRYVYSKNDIFLDVTLKTYENSNRFIKDRQYVLEIYDTFLDGAYIFQVHDRDGLVQKRIFFPF